MKRYLIALPLAGIMMSVTPALAQSSAPAPNDEPAQTAPLPDDEAGNARSGCVDLTQDVEAGETPAAEETGDAGSSGENGSQASANNDSETEPTSGPNSGTSPGGTASTGWTGGTGGSDIGTSQSDEVESSSQQEHPAVASGLDPISGETAVEGPQAPAEPAAATATVTTDEDATAC